VPPVPATTCRDGRGDRLEPSALRRRYKAWRDAAELPPLRFHDLRHTAGSLLVRVLDPVTVTDIMRHADLDDRAVSPRGSGDSAG